MPASHGSALLPLDGAELIEVSGVDAIAFAQAQFASDVAGLAVGTWQWSAWLTAQGRTRSVFALLRTAADHLLIWLPLGGAAVMREQVVRFVLRAKVQVVLRENWALARLESTVPVAATPQALIERDGGYAFALPGPAARVAWLGPALGARADSGALNAWRSLDVAAGLPWLDRATADEFVPQALGLERLDAVRFDKGCYPGQEIAARLRYRGGVKQHLHRVVLAGHGDVLPGTIVKAAADNAGVVLYGAMETPQRHVALAVLADAALDGPLVTAAGHSIQTADRT